MKKINVIVKKEFLDRYTGIKRKEGERITLDEKRYLEIRRQGNFVTVDKKAENAKPGKETTEIKK